MTYFKLGFIVLLLMTAAQAQSLERCTLHFKNSEHRNVSLTVEIARTDIQRNEGLMYRKTLEKNSGMLFVFENERIMNFWMKNTYIPLSIAYIDRYGIIREIHHMKPLDTSLTYMSRNRALYAVEVNQGWFERNKITPGCKIELHGCLGK